MTVCSASHIGYVKGDTEMYKSRFLLAAVLYSFLFGIGMKSAGEADAKSDSTAVKAAVMHFIAALDNLDVDGFLACFTEDASMFFPHRSDIHRIDGREAMRQPLKQKFDMARSRLSGPPYLHLEALRTRVQMLDENSAVVTWETDRASHIGRRTAILQKIGGGWFFASYHASNYDVPTSDAKASVEEPRPKDGFAETQR